MLTSITDGILCCLTGKTGSSVVLPVEPSGATDGFEFVEVKPGRVLRVRHIIPEQPPKPDPEQCQTATDQDQDQDQDQTRDQDQEQDQDQSKDESTDLKTDKQQEQQQQEGKEEKPSSKGQGGSTVHCKRKITVYRNGQLVIENLGDVLHSEILQCQNGDVEPCTTLEVELSDYSSVANAPVTPDPKPTPLPPPTSATLSNGSAVSGQQKPAPPPRRKRRKPKRTVLIDSERNISSCKGTDSDVALFFVHGVGGSLDIWGSQLDFFSRLGYEVIAPDLAGHGASKAPQIAAAYTFYALAEDLRAIFKRYARKRNILIGHSYG